MAASAEAERELQADAEAAKKANITPEVQELLKQRYAAYQASGGDRG